MATVTGLTAERMLEIEAESIVDAHLDGAYHLILTRHDDSTIDVGNVRGPIGDASDTIRATGVGQYFGPNANGGAGNRLHVALTANTAQLLAEGTGADVDLYLQAKGAGQVVLNKPDATAGVTMNSAGTVAIHGLVEIVDPTGAVVGQLDPTGVLKAVGPDHYFGSFALDGGTGIRARLTATEVGTPTIGLIAESGSGAPNVEAILRPKGTGKAQLQNSANNPVVSAGLAAGVRTLAFFSSGGAAVQVVNGSRGGATVAVLTNLLAALAAYGLITDSTTA